MNNNNVTYIDPDHRSATTGCTLNTNLYYKDDFYLIEKGNEKLAKAKLTALNTYINNTSANRPTASTRTPAPSAELSPPTTTAK